MAVMTLATAVTTVLLGSLIGLSYGLIGAGGSILAVPLLVYAIGMEPHVAIGTDTVAASLSALWSLAGHARAGAVHWGAASVYALASMTGAATGAQIGKVLDGNALLMGLGALMIVSAVMMLRRSMVGAAAIRATPGAAPYLVASGFGVGVIAGLVGVGGGFLTVPALVLITGMPVLSAVASSLLSVAAVAATTAASYSLSGLVDWPVAGLLIAGGFVGGYAGVRLAETLAGRKRALTVVFSAVVAVMGLYVTARALARVI